jgi:DNA-binding beta-propeller fold protein YncE
MTEIDSTALPTPATAPAEPADEEEKRRRRKLLALLLLLLAAVAVIAYLILRATGKESILPPIGTADTPTYQFSIYGVARPLGVAVSTSGERVYVTESDGPRLVHVFDREGKEIGRLMPPTGSTGAHVPVYVAIDPGNDDVYVSDRLHQQIYVYDAKGAYKREFAPPRKALGGGWQPLGLAFDGQRHLYVTDASGPANRVLVFDRSGKKLRAFGSRDGLSFPNGIAVDRNGNVYVADSNNGRVVVFDKTGKLVAGIGQGVGSQRFGLPRGLAIDGKSRLFVVDTTDHSVQLVQIGNGTVPELKLVGAFGVEGSSEGALEYPNGDAVDKSGRVYVTDRENNRVQVWSY